MENQQFDEVVKQLTLTRLSRLGALRGLAVSALTGLVGAGLLSDETEAKKGKKDKAKGKGKGKGKSHKNKDGRDNAKGEHWGWPHGPAKKVEICHCQTLRLDEKAAQAHLKQHPTDRMGSCAAQTTTTTTTAPPTTTTTTTTTAPPTTTTTTTTTTTAPPCVPRTGACDWASTCCNELDVCGTEGASAGKCCGGWQAPCSSNADCCPCYENDINRCICATSLGYCIMTEIG